MTELNDGVSELQTFQELEERDLKRLEELHPSLREYVFELSSQFRETLKKMGRDTYEEATDFPDETTEYADLALRLNKILRRIYESVESEMEGINLREFVKTKDIKLELTGRVSKASLLPNGVVCISTYGGEIIWGDVQSSDFTKKLTSPTPIMIGNFDSKKDKVLAVGWKGEYAFIPYGETGTTEWRSLGISPITNVVAGENFSYISDAQGRIRKIDNRTGLVQNDFNFDDPLTILVGVTEDDLPVIVDGRTVKVLVSSELLPGGARENKFRCSVKSEVNTPQVYALDKNWFLAIGDNQIIGELQEIYIGKISADPTYGRDYEKIKIPLRSDLNSVEVTSFALGPLGEYIFGLDKQILIYNPYTKEPYIILDTERTIKQVLYHPSGKIVAVTRSGPGNFVEVFEEDF